MLTNEFPCDIITVALGICVMVAQQTLTLYVWVRALDPQPKQADLFGRLFVLAGDLSSTQLQNCLPILDWVRKRAPSHLGASSQGPGRSSLPGAMRHSSELYAPTSRVNQTKYKRTPSGVLFALAGDLSSTQLQNCLSILDWVRKRAPSHLGACSQGTGRSSLPKAMRHSSELFAPTSRVNQTKCKRQPKN